MTIGNNLLQVPTLMIKKVLNVFINNNEFNDF